MLGGVDAFPNNLTSGRSFKHESFRELFVGFIPWNLPPGTMEGGLDGEPIVLLDHDLAMVWTPHWLTNTDELMPVGINCFTSFKVRWSEDLEE
jgi:hypothetical protein